MALVLSITACSGQVKGSCQSCHQTKPLFELTATGSVLGYSRTETFHLCKSCANEAIEALESDPVASSYTSHDLTPLRK